MGRFQGDLPDRSFQFACKVVELVDRLPNNFKGWEIEKQLLRSGTSVGSNIQEADHAFSESDFAFKCSVARKEAAETGFWLRLCRSTGLLDPSSVAPMSQESDELTRILSTVVKNTQTQASKPRQ
ncbi:MAG: four helix bundle protein [Phycisphaerales bacterium]|nr:four helix bundle protein [Phycisphaerales bacterium]